MRCAAKCRIFGVARFIWKSKERTLPVGLAARRAASIVLNAYPADGLHQFSRFTVHVRLLTGQSVGCFKVTLYFH